MIAKCIAGLFFVAMAAAVRAEPRTDTATENGSPQSQAPAAAADQGTDSPADDDKKKKEREKEERETRPRQVGAETTVPQTVADAPLPPQGAPEAKPTIVRGPLTFRQDEFSLGADHLLSSDLAIGGLVGYSRNKLHRFQTSLFDGIPGEENDVNIRTKSGSVAAILSWFPAPDVFMDAALSYAHISFHTERLVNNLITFSGDTSGRGYGISLSGGYVARFGTLAIVPQVGIDYIDSRIDGFRMTAVPEGSTGPSDVFNVDIADQRRKTLTGNIGAQLRWSNSVPFGTLVPYLRAQYRHRLSSSGNIVRTSADGAEDILIDPAESNPGRSVTTLSLGLLAQFMGGVSAFIDYGESVNGGDLRLRRLALGVRLEF